MRGVPRISFTDETEVFLGGKEVRAHYYGLGHTNGDAAVYVPDLKVVHTGDLLTNGAPLIDYSANDSAVAWTKTSNGHPWPPACIHTCGSDQKGHCVGVRLAGYGAGNELAGIDDRRAKEAAFLTGFFN